MTEPYDPDLSNAIETVRDLTAAYSHPSVREHVRLVLAAVEQVAREPSDAEVLAVAWAMYAEMCRYGADGHEPPFQPHECGWSRGRWETQARVALKAAAAHRTQEGRE